jgi:hypothetical protein
MKHLQEKQIYLNPAFFCGRAVFYFVVWNSFAYLLSSWSRRQDQAVDPELIHRLGLVSGLGLTAYGITINFATVDWLMSIQPAFHSSIVGPWFASGAVLMGLSFAVSVLAYLGTRPPLAHVCSQGALNDQGSLLFSFLIIWAYMEFFQFMLIWIANLPTDVLWYLPRSQGGWYYVAWAIFLLHFAAPFFLLLVRDIKRDVHKLAVVAALMLGMHLVHSFYTVLPAYHADRLTEHWMDFVMPWGVGGIWLAYYLWQLGRWPLLALHDVNFQSAEELRHKDEEEALHDRELHYV